MRSNQFIINRNVQSEGGPAIDPNRGIQAKKPCVTARGSE